MPCKHLQPTAYTCHERKQSFKASQLEETCGPCPSRNIDLFGCQLPKDTHPFVWIDEKLCMEGTKEQFKQLFLSILEGLDEMYSEDEMEEILEEAFSL